MEPLHYEIGQTLIVVSPDGSINPQIGIVVEVDGQILTLDIENTETNECKGVSFETHGSLWDNLDTGTDGWTLLSTELTMATIEAQLDDIMRRIGEYGTFQVVNHASVTVDPDCDAIYWDLMLEDENGDRATVSIPDHYTEGAIVNWL